MLDKLRDTHLLLRQTRPQQPSGIPAGRHPLMTDTYPKLAEMVRAPA